VACGGGGGSFSGSGGGRDHPPQGALYIVRVYRVIKKQSRALSHRWPQRGKPFHP